jgi:hypothetical protein
VSAPYFRCPTPASIAGVAGARPDHPISCEGFIVPVWNASVLGQLTVEPQPGDDFNLETSADGEVVIGFGTLSCSSQASMIRSIVLI